MGEGPVNCAGVPAVVMGDPVMVDINGEFVIIIAGLGEITGCEGEGACA
jgi:hypothetical protein